MTRLHFSVNDGSCELICTRYRLTNRGQPIGTRRPSRVARRVIWMKLQRKSIRFSLVSFGSQKISGKSQLLSERLSVRKSLWLITFLTRGTYIRTTSSKISYLDNTSNNINVTSQNNLTMYTHPKQQYIHSLDHNNNIHTPFITTTVYTPP